MTNSEPNRGQIGARSSRGWLKYGNPVGDFSKAARCGAKNRRGLPCQGPAMRNGRCRLHGGLSTGPKTAEGLERLRRAHTKHGRYAKPVPPAEPKTSVRAPRVKPGRQRVEMDPTQLFQVAGLASSDSEIAEYFGVSRDTITRRKRERRRLRFQYTDLDGTLREDYRTFEGIIRLAGALRNFRIQQTQFALAAKGNARAAIFLWRKYLGKKSFSDLEAAGSANPKKATRRGSAK